MRIVVTGGGSGGHITPVLAVAHNLKLEEPGIEVIYIGHHGDSLADIPSQDKNIDHVYFVRAGKLRRYHREGIKQLLDIPTDLKNIRDMFYVVIGLWQSFWLLNKLKPDVVFIKGGFVGLPVGLSAALLHIPYVTHDSDPMPGLANRIIAPWAKIHAVALPKEVYSYPSAATTTVGVPLSDDFHPLSKQENEQYRKQLKLDKFQQIIFVTGGGLGAQRINTAIFAIAKELLGHYPNLVVVHQAGRKGEEHLKSNYKDLLSAQEQSRVVVVGFITNLYQYSGVADVIITRAGATAIAEFAAQSKACIVIPSPFLAGGHQLKNAKVLSDRKVVKLVDEDALVADPITLMAPLVDLLDNPAKAKLLGEKLGTLAIPDAAHRLAMILLEIAEAKNS